MTDKNRHDCKATATEETLDERIARLAKPTLEGEPRHDTFTDASFKVVQQLPLEDVICIAQEAVLDRLNHIYSVERAGADWEKWVDLVEDQTKYEPLVPEAALGIIGDSASWAYLADKTDTNREGWLEASREDFLQATDSEIERANRLVAMAIRT